MKLICHTQNQRILQCSHLLSPCFTCQTLVRYLLVGLFSVLAMTCRLCSHRSRLLMPPPSLPPPSPGGESSLPASGIPSRGSGSSLVHFPSSRNPEARWFIMICLYPFLNLSCLLSQILDSKSSDSFSQFLNEGRTWIWFLWDRHCISSIVPSPHLLCFWFVCCSTISHLSWSLSHTVGHLPTLTCNCIYRHLTWILVHFLRQRVGIPSIGIAPGTKKDFPKCLLNENFNSLYRTWLQVLWQYLHYFHFEENAQPLATITCYSSL